MKQFFKSLTFKIGVIIILVEIIVLAVTGFFYINRFSAQIDERVRDRIELPGALVAGGLLSFGSVADEEVMTKLVGEGLIDGIVVGADGNIFHSLNPNYARQEITAVPGVDPAWFDENLAESLLVETADGLASVTPIRAFAEETSSFFVYIKVGAEQAEIEKRVIIGWFVLGSIFSVVITSIAIIYLFNSTILTRIRELLGVLGQVESGNLAARVSDSISPDEIGVLQSGVNSMATQLEEIVGTLEERVAERTKSLEASAEISNRITMILDLEELLQFVVNHIRAEFNFYYVHIYLVEEQTGDLIMVEGVGEVGQQLKEKGHRLQAGRGIVGTTASTGEYFLSNNVNEVLNFVRNPLLPDTNSELAVPLRKGDQMLGVLDIQSEELNRFTPEDVALMQSLANQIAPAIDNARLLTETQAVLREVERLNRRLTREGWEEFSEEITTSGYRFIGGDKSAIRPDSEAWLPPMKQATVQRQLVKASGDGNGDAQKKAELAVPLILRGEVIGVLGVKREKSPNWAEEELSAVEAVADQVTRALENARLSKEQEKTIVQLKEIDRLKSEFLTSMSHELRTPLNSNIGFADVLLQGIDGVLNDLAMNDIQLIYNSGQHLLALINDILDISKIEAGMMELVRHSLDIVESVNDVQVASTSLLKDKPVELMVEVEDDLPPIYADKLRINQVLLNLVSNAVKFTAEGTVTIKAEVREEILDKMYISVIDTGIGIPPDKTEAIFDRFRQADSSTTRQYGGTG
ncbi:MAG: GAF domain-containing protein, partial [Proteobacteria bacterium]|nr:GAF domain-containing protein [Pseudomonadota bacterium]